MQKTSAPNRHASFRLILAAAGISWSVLAGLQILVLNPLASAPGRSLSQIHFDLDAAGESLAPPLVMLLCGLPAVAAAASLLLLRNGTLPAHHGYSALLAALALGAPVYFFASFGPGMALADTYLIGGADHSPWGTVLVGISGAALLCLLLMEARRRLRGAALADGQGGTPC